MVGGRKGILRRIERKAGESIAAAAKSRFISREQRREELGCLVKVSRLLLSHALVVVTYVHGIFHVSLKERKPPHLVDFLADCFISERNVSAYVELLRADKARSLASIFIP